MAVFLSPLVANQFGWPSAFYGTAALVFVWAVVFGLVARDAPVQVKPSSLPEMCKVLMTERLSGLLALFYFLTFGGFIAFAIYLPTLLREEFKLVASDAGFRAAVFVVFSTVMRPAGGWLSDKIGGAKVLSAVFIGITIFAPLLAWPSILPFSVGALGCAMFLGLGNGAVFKLVPEIFPRQVATVSGLVGAFGGLGDFFPPLLLGVSRQYLGVMWPCFALLAALSFALYIANERVFVSRQVTRDLSLPPNLVRAAEQVRAGFVATLEIWSVERQREYQVILDGFLKAEIGQYWDLEAALEGNKLVLVDGQMLAPVFNREDFVSFRNRKELAASIVPEVMAGDLASELECLLEPVVG